jgi:hypothetical protein
MKVYFTPSAIQASTKTSAVATTQLSQLKSFFSDLFLAKITTQSENLAKYKYMASVTNPSSVAVSSSEMDYFIPMESWGAGDFCHILSWHINSEFRLRPFFTSSINVSLQVTDSSITRWRWFDDSVCMITVTTTSDLVVPVEMASTRHPWAIVPLEYRYYGSDFTNILALAVSSDLTSQRKFSNSSADIFVDTSSTLNARKGLTSSVTIALSSTSTLKPPVRMESTSNNITVATTAQMNPEVAVRFGNTNVDIFLRSVPPAILSSYARRFMESTSSVALTQSSAYNFFNAELDYVNLEVLAEEELEGFQSITVVETEVFMTQTGFVVGGGAVQTEQFYAQPETSNIIELETPEVFFSTGTAPL